MLDEFQPPVSNSHDPSDDGLDQRSIRSEAKTMLYMSQAVDRSLKKTYRIKPSIMVPVKKTVGAQLVASASQKNFSQSTLVFKGSKSVGSLEEDSSIITQSISNSLEPPLKYEGITFPLIRCERFISSCWRAFLENSTEPMTYSKFDRCEMALSFDLIPAAIAVLSRKVSLESIEEYCAHFQLGPNSCLSWAGFKDFSAYIFTPILQKALLDAGLPLRTTTSAPHAIDNDMAVPSNSYNYNEQWPSLRKESHPYEQMIRKHRFKTCIDIEQLHMPLAEESVRSVELPVGKYSANSNVAGVKVPIGMLHDAVIAAATKSLRADRATRQAEEGTCIIQHVVADDAVVDCSCCCCYC